jgi:hypothetical protein
LARKHVYSVSVLRIAFALVLLSSVSSAWAWGPHDKITEAALKVLPEGERWKTALGEKNLKDMSFYCRMPDMRGWDLGDYYADDYLLFRGMPEHPRHVMPYVQEAFDPYFRRALQALRTETPVNACRQIGPIVHFLEDVGAPPHAKEKCPHHHEMETWIRGEQIAIDGYQPRLLGKTDDEALAGLKQRVAELVEFSKARAERALPLVEKQLKEKKPDPSEVEPILLESALECSRATADLLYTLFTLGLAPQSQDAGLAGTVTAATLPVRNDHGANILLLDTQFNTLATSVSPQPTNNAWQGTYAFSHLPPGTYRVMAYRVGSQPQISSPITIEAGKQAKADFSLPATPHPGNLVQNPDAKLETLQAGQPDRWKLFQPGKGAGKESSKESEKQKWISGEIKVEPKTTYHCGILVKDPSVKVQLVVRQKPDKDHKTPLSQKYPLTLAKTSSQASYQAEKVLTLDDQPWLYMLIEIQTDRPLSEVLQEVWVAP